MFSFVLTLWMLGACRGDAEESNEVSSDSTWEEVTAGEGGDSKDDSAKEDSGKDEETCGDEVVAGESCEGSLDDTLCVDTDGVWWWCEGNVWVYKDE